MRSMNKLRTVFVDGNGIIAQKSSKEIVSLLQQDVNIVLRLHSDPDVIYATPCYDDGTEIVLRLHSDPDVIYATPCYYDGTEEVIWFDYTNAKNNLAQLVGVDANAEIVYYTGE